MTEDRRWELVQEATRYSYHIDPYWENADTPSRTDGCKAFKRRYQELLKQELERGN